MDLPRHLFRYLRVKSFRISALSALILFLRTVFGGDKQTQIVKPNFFSCCNASNVEANTSNFTGVENLSYYYFDGFDSGFDPELRHIRCIIAQLILINQTIQIYPGGQDPSSRTTFFLQLKRRSEQLVEHLAYLLLHLLKKENNLGDEIAGRKFEILQRYRFEAVWRLVYLSVGDYKTKLQQRLHWCINRGLVPYSHALTTEIQGVILNIRQQNLNMQRNKPTDLFFQKPGLLFLFLVFNIRSIIAEGNLDAWIEYIMKGNCFQRYDPNKPFDVFRNIFLACLITVIKNHPIYSEIKTFPLTYIEIYNECGGLSLANFVDQDIRMKNIENLITRLEELKTKLDSRKVVKFFCGLRSSDGQNK